MYTPLLMCGYAAALLLMLVGFRGVRRSAPNLRGVRQLTWFVLCELSGVLLVAARPWAPDWAAVLLANSLLFVGPLFVYLAAAKIIDLKPHLFPWPAGVYVAAIPAFFWLAYTDSDLIVRLMVHCAVVSAIYGTTAVLLFRHTKPAVRHAGRACAWLLTLAAAVQIAWFLLGFFCQRRPNFAHPDMINVGFSYLSMILALATVVGLVWLALSLNRQDLHRMAQTDVLTGLLNRRAFEEILRRELSRCGRSGGALGIMLIDLDYFKQVNDSLGHFAGDDVLRQIALVLHDGTRPSDVLARYGGEEFVILLRNAGFEESHAAAERIRVQIAALGGLPGNVTLTASIGVAVSLPQETATEFLLRADQALYRSKRKGRNLVSVYREADRVPANAD
jgi:diguanylate cyclase (GGDEF)-like protein